MKDHLKQTKILFLSQRFLFPMDTGGKIRTGNILEYLKKIASITVISNVESPKDDKYFPQMNGLCDKFIPVPWKENPRYTLKFYLKIGMQSFSRFPISVLNDYSAELENTVYNELKNNYYDLAICDFLQSTLNFRRVNSVPTILFQHNVESTIAKRHLEKAKDPVSILFWWLQYRRMHKHEKAMCRQFDGIIAVSENDMEFMRKRFNVDNVYDIPTGVDTNFYQPQGVKTHKKQLVFTGSMDWLPNEDAMIYFIQEIFPLIKAQESETQLVIVGRRPTPRLQKLTDGRKDIIATGWVEDTRPYIEESSVFIVPIRIGGGTRMKIYEALSMGKGMVSTTIGAEGLPLTHEKHLLIADGKEEFARNVLRLLRDKELSNTLGKSARAYVYSNFRWEHVAKVFDDVCKKVIHSSKKLNKTHH